MRSSILSKCGVAWLTVVIVALLGAPSGAVAGDEAASPTAPPSPAERLCEISDPRVGDVSGLVVIENGYAVVNDRGSQEESSTVHLLAADCSIAMTLQSPQRPTDIEDLARTGDGTYWLADIGDNDSARDDIVQRALHPAAGAATDYVLRYPAGARNAEAVLLTDHRTPVIATKSSDGVAELYLATRRLAGEPAGPIGLRKAGELELKPTGTPGGAPDGNLDEANVLVTGGAVSHDGRRVVLRTYTDAYEWPIPVHACGDRIVRALTSIKPDRTPVPGEGQGEAIAYSLDDSRLLTVSEGTGKPIQAWKPVRSSPQPDEESRDWIGWVSAGTTAGVLAIGLLIVVLWRRRVRQR